MPGPKKCKKKQKEEESRAELEKLVKRLRALADHPENQNCVWLVEMVIPPGSFVARSVPEPVDRAALTAEIRASAEALKKGNDPNRHRFLITYTDTGGLARQYVKALAEEIPQPTVPMEPFDRFTIDAILHTQYIGDEEY